jgi:hypothetical protein
MLMLAPDATPGRIAAAILIFSAWCSLSFMRSALLYLREGEGAESEAKNLEVATKQSKSKPSR